MITKLHVITGYTETHYQLLHCYLLSMATHLPIINYYIVTYYQWLQLLIINNNTVTCYQ